MLPSILKIAGGVGFSFCFRFQDSLLLNATLFSAQNHRLDFLLAPSAITRAIIMGKICVGPNNRYFEQVLVFVVVGVVILVSWAINGMHCQVIS